MSRAAKLREKIVSGGSDKNLRFDEICIFAESVGFEKRKGSGSHAVYHHKKVPHILNFQSLGGGKAKPYQVKQLREIVLDYNL